MQIGIDLSAFEFNAVYDAVLYLPNTGYMFMLSEEGKVFLTLLPITINISPLAPFIIKRYSQCLGWAKDLPFISLAQF